MAIQVYNVDVFPLTWFKGFLIDVKPGVAEGSIFSRPQIPLPLGKMQPGLPSGCGAPGHCPLAK